MARSPNNYSYTRDNNGRIIGLKDNTTGKLYNCSPKSAGSRDLICVAQRPRPDDDWPMGDDNERLVVVFDQHTDEPIVYPENSI